MLYLLHALGVGLKQGLNGSNDQILGKTKARTALLTQENYLKLVNKTYSQRKKNQDIAISKSKINKYKIRSLGVLMFLDV